MRPKTLLIMYHTSIRAGNLDPHQPLAGIPLAQPNSG